MMRSALALALALGLTACGGKATFPVNVTVSGLQYGPLVLTTNGMDLDVNPSTTAGAVVTAQFPNTLQYGDVYNVLVKTQPPHQTCVAPNVSTTDTAGHLATIDAQFTCSLNRGTIGGNIHGLTADGLVLTNGSTGGTATISKTASTYTFSQTVAFGDTYGVTVLTQPTGQTCTVANGAGTMNDDGILHGVTNIDITCQ
jgi:hypothetical protein